MSRRADLLHRGGPCRFLVLGGAGFVGRALTRDLTESGHEVHVIDVPTADRRTAVTGARTSAEIVPGSHNQLAKHMARLRPDTVIDLAYLVGEPAERDLHLATQRNIVDPLCALEAAHRAGARRYVQASSIAVYGPTQSTWGREVAEDDMLPLNQHTTIYGAFKCLNEFQLARFAAHSGLVCSSVRLSIVVGAARSRGLASWPSQFLSKLAHGACTAHVPVPSSARASLLLTSDAARLVRLVATHPTPHTVYNSGGNDLSAGELAERAQACIGPVTVTFDDDGPTLPFVHGVSGARAREHLDFRLSDVDALAGTVMREATLR